MVAHGFFNRIPGQPDLAAGQGFPLEPLRECQGRKIALVNLEQVVTVNAITDIVQIIDTLADKPEGFRLCQTGIGRKCERCLPGLDIAGLGGDLSQRIDGNGFSPLSGKKIGQLRRKT